MYGPGTVNAPLGYEGIYVSQADAVILAIADLACSISPGSPPFPPTHFVVDNGYPFDCIWTFATWHVPGNPSLVLGGRCAVVPSRPANGSVAAGTTGNHARRDGAHGDADLVEQPGGVRLHLAANGSVDHLGR